MSLGTFSINIGGTTGGGGGGVADGKFVRTTRFATISSGTSGTVTLPSNATVVLDDFGGTVDAVITTLSGGKPLKQAALSATGAVVSTTFDSSGNYVLSDIPVSYPIAIVYRVQQTLANFDDTASSIWGEPDRMNARFVTIGATFDGLGSVITPGTVCYVVMPHTCTLSAWTLVSDQTGSMVVDVWKVAYGSFPPLVANTIVGADPPTITASRTGQNQAISAWTMAVTANDAFAFSVTSCSSITRATLSLRAIVV